MGGKLEKNIELGLTSNSGPFVDAGVGTEDHNISNVHST
jgi:hypothetical protein